MLFGVVALEYKDNFSVRSKLFCVCRSEPGEPIERREVKLTPTDQFQRFALAGYIDVKSVAPPGRDIYPPSRILDLKVTKALYEDSSITLEWTAVGDDLDEGNGRLI